MAGLSRSRPSTQRLLGDLPLRVPRRRRVGANGHPGRRVRCSTKARRIRRVSLGRQDHRLLQHRRALSPEHKRNELDCSGRPETECEAIVLCTDGVSDDLEDVEGFMAEFVKVFRGLAQLTASRQAHEMLENWPVPKHSETTRPSLASSERRSAISDLTFTRGGKVVTSTTTDTVGQRAGKRRSRCRLSHHRSRPSRQATCLTPRAKSTGHPTCRSSSRNVRCLPLPRASPSLSRCRRSGMSRVCDVAPERDGTVQRIRVERRREGCVSQRDNPLMACGHQGQEHRVDSGALFRSGSTKRRLLALAKSAAILARVHAAGLGSGDISQQLLHGRRRFTGGMADRCRQHAL